MKYWLLPVLLAIGSGCTRATSSFVGGKSPAPIQETSISIPKSSIVDELKKRGTFVGVQTSAIDEHPCWTQPEPRAAAG